MKKFLLPIIVFQIVVILFLGFKIISNNRKVIISNIKGESVQNPQESKLVYYYDLVPDRVELSQPDWLDEPVKYTINKDGLNERFDYSVNKPEKTYRIITLGDSFTFGQNVNTGSNWPEVLEDFLNKNYQCKKYDKFEVINLGVYGYDIEYAVEKYRLKGQKYNPDLIVWMLLDETRVREKIEPLAEECGTNFTKKNISTDECWEYSRSVFIKAVGKKYINNYLKVSFKKIYNYFNKDIVVIDLDGVHSEILSGISPLKVLEISHINNWHELVNPDSHPNAKGHEYYSEKIYDYLTGNRIIDCE